MQEIAVLESLKWMEHVYREKVSQEEEQLKHV